MEFKIRIRSDGTAEVVNDLGRVEGRLADVGNAAAQAGDEAQPAMDKTRGAVEDVGDALDDTTRSAGGFLDRMGGVRGVVAGLAAAVASFSAKEFLQGLIAEQSTYERNMLRTQAIIDATGASAGFTAEQLRLQARELALGTLQSVEGVERAQQILMTFRNVTGDIFVRATEQATNLSVAMNTDLNSAIKQLGKALDEPARGLEGLREAGVSFSDSQKEVIQSLIEAGEVATAQALILDEIAGKVGDIARREAAGWDGMVDTMDQALEEGRLALAEYFDVAQTGAEILEQLAGYVFEFNEGLRAGEYDAVISGIGGIVKVAGVYLGLVTGIKTAQLAATAVKATYAATLWLVGGGATAAAAGLTLMQKAMLPVMALFAGWELGKWARENFTGVEKAGIVMASSVHRAIVWLRGEFDLFAENVKFALTNPFDYARGKIADFFEWIQGLGKTALKFLGLDGLADQIRTDFDGLRGTTAAEHEKTLQQIRANTLREMGQIGAIYNDLLDQVGESAGQAGAAAGASEGNFLRMSATGADGLRNIRAFAEGAAAALNGVSTGADSATSATRDLAGEVDALRRRVDPAYRAVSELADAEFLLWEAAAAGVITQEQLAEMIGHVHTAADRAEGSVRGFGDGVRAGAAEADPFARAWEEASNRIDRTFADAWKGAFDSFRSFARGLGDAFKQLLGELAHAAITRPILVSLGLAAGPTGAAGSGMPGVGGDGGGAGGFGFNPMSFLGGSSLMANAGGAMAGLGSRLGFQGMSDMGAGMIMNAAPNWHLGVAGLLGGFAGNALFGGRGYSGLGGSLGATAGYALGTGGAAMMGQFGAIAGPVGAIAGAVLGSALGSLFGGSGERFPRTVASGTGTYRDGAFTGAGPDTSWEHTGEDQFGGEMNTALDSLQESFASRVGALFDAFDIDESINTTVRVRLRRTSGRLVGEFFGTLGEEIEESFRTHDQYGEDAEIEDAFKGFVEDVLSKGVVGAIEASGLPEYVKRMFDGLSTSADVEAAIASIVHFQDLVTRDVIGQAALDYERAGRTATDAYREQLDAVLALAAEYDGTLAGTRSLAAAMEQHQAAAYQLAVALHQASDATSALFGGLAGDIRESLMSEEALYNHRKEQVDALTAAMSNMTDPAQIMATAEQIERLVREMWSSLEDDTQRAMQADGFLNYLDGVTELAQSQIEKALAALEDDQERLGETIDESLARIATEFDEAAEQQLAAAREMSAAAGVMRDAAREMAGAAATPKRVAVGVTVSGQPARVTMSEVGG